MPSVETPRSGSELELDMDTEDEPEWKRMRTPSPEPGNRSYELPEAFCIKQVLLATDPALPVLPNSLLQAQREKPNLHPSKEASPPRFCAAFTDGGNLPAGSFHSTPWNSQSHMPPLTGQQVSGHVVLVGGYDQSAKAADVWSRKTTGSFSSKDGAFTDWPASSPSLSGVTSRRSTGSFSKVEFFPDEMNQAAQMSGTINFAGIPDIKPSRGSEGHPHCCQPACKYVRKTRGCKDGDQCAHCHLCVWKNSTKPQKKSTLRQGTEQSVN